VHSTVEAVIAAARLGLISFNRGIESGPVRKPAILADVAASQWDNDATTVSPMKGGSSCKGSLRNWPRLELPRASCRF
jgi:hypothetical protein